MAILPENIFTMEAASSTGKDTVGKDTMKVEKTTLVLLALCVVLLVSVLVFRPF